MAHVPAALTAPAVVGWGHANFKDPCINHDNCYHHGYCSYGKTRSECDDAFFTDMSSVCDDLAYKPWRWEEIPVCAAAAGLFYASVKNFAADSYLGSQGYISCYQGIVRCSKESCPDAFCVLSEDRARRAGLTIWWW